MYFEGISVGHLELYKWLKFVRSVESRWGATNCIRGVGGLHSLTLKEEANRLDALALTLTKCRHELLQFGRALDLEEDFVVVIRDFDVQVLRGRGIAGATWASTLVLAGHFDDVDVAAQLDRINYERAVESQ